MSQTAAVTGTNPDRRDRADHSDRPARRGPLWLLAGCALLMCATWGALQAKRSGASPAAGPLATGPSPPPSSAAKMKGLTLVAPPEPFPSDPMTAVQAVGASWIAAVPYAYTRAGVPGVRFRDLRWQWWGERKEGILQTVRLAHRAGVHVMLKPQIYVPGGWTGSLDFGAESEWAAWESEYEEYLLTFADLAQREHVDLFCIGTEFRTAIQRRPAFWKTLTEKVRRIYTGKLTYSANWDDWDRVPFWRQLDYVGIGGYFPLVDAKTPDVTQLLSAWRPIVQRLRDFSQQQGRPILFTEFGYLSVDGGGGRNWELEKGIDSRAVNEQAQANCLDAMFSSLYREPWWAGGFLWKWFPNMRGHEGYPERDYTPQGKLGERVLLLWYTGKSGDEKNGAL